LDEINEMGIVVEKKRPEEMRGKMRGEDGKLAS
jgi:hypothetical protein